MRESEEQSGGMEGVMVVAVMVAVKGGPHSYAAEQVQSHDVC